MCLCVSVSLCVCLCVSVCVSVCVCVCLVSVPEPDPIIWVAQCPCAGTLSEGSVATSWVGIHDWQKLGTRGLATPVRAAEVDSATSTGAALRRPPGTLASAAVCTRPQATHRHLLSSHPPTHNPPLLCSLRPDVTACWLASLVSPPLSLSLAPLLWAPSPAFTSIVSPL